MNVKTFATGLITAAILVSCTDNKPSDGDGSTEKRVHGIKEEAVSYKADSGNLHGFVYYDTINNDPRPAVLVVHEWWGLNDYTRARARQLAEMGYVAMAVDMYGDGLHAEDPEKALSLALPFYKDPKMAAARLAAAADKIRSYPMADSSRVAAIGYCFGGSMVLEAAKLGGNYDGVVSFHGDFPERDFNKGLWKAPVLIAHGGADPFVPEEKLLAFQKRLDSIGVSYKVKVYPGATHAFTNPASTQTGKKFNIPIAYNGAADTASWNEMKQFFSTIFK